MDNIGYIFNVQNTAILLFSMLDRLYKERVSNLFKVQSR